MIADEIIIHSFYRGVIQTLGEISTDAENWANHLTQKYPEISIDKITHITEQIGRYDIAVYLQNITCSRDI